MGFAPKREREIKVDCNCRSSFRSSLREHVGEVNTTRKDWDWGQGNKETTHAKQKGNGYHH